MKIYRTVKITKKSIIYTVLTTLAICAIFVHSSMPASVSSEESDSVRGFLQIILEKLGLNILLTDHIVRKCAHFIEFFVLGIFSELTFDSYFCNAKKAILPTCYLTVIVPLIDETIQLFTLGRSGQVSDIWLDYSGALCAVLILTIILYLKRRKRDKG